MPLRTADEYVKSLRDRLIVEIAQIVLHEGDEPDALADLRHAHVLPPRRPAFLV